MKLKRRNTLNKKPFIFDNSKKIAKKKTPAPELTL